MNRDFEAGGKKFKLNKINAFDQFHIVRRLAPVLGELLPVLGKIKGMSAEQLDDPKFLEEHLGDFAPVLDGFAKLSDQDSNRVLMGLCSAVEMHQPESNSWAFVVRGQNLMFQDLELPTLLQIAGRSFAYNMADFFRSAPQVSHGGK